MYRPTGNIDFDRYMQGLPPLLAGEQSQGIIPYHDPEKYKKACKGKKK